MSQFSSIDYLRVVQDMKISLKIDTFSWNINTFLLQHSNIPKIFHFYWKFYTKINE